MITTSTGAIMRMGSKNSYDSEVFYEFTDEQPFVGFLGYQKTSRQFDSQGDEDVLEIMGLGVVKSVCALARPPKK
jgi:hypothetical protein